MNKLLLLIIGFIFLPFSVQAFEISPLKHKITIDPGTESRAEISIKNTDNISEIYTPVVLCARADTAGRIDFSSETCPAKDWVIPLKKDVLLEAGENGRTTFVLKSPLNAMPGSYFLGLGIVNNPPAGQMAIGTRLVSILELQVAGTAREALRINYFKSKNNIFNQAPWSFQINLENTGNVSVPLEASLILRRSTGEILEIKKILSTKDILPASQRELETKISPKEIKMGNYYVDLVVDYGISKQKNTTSISFWYIPKSYFIISGGILFLLILILIFRRKKVKIS